MRNVICAVQNTLHLQGYRRKGLCLTCTEDEKARCCTSTETGSFLWKQVVEQWQYTLEVTMCETPGPSYQS